MTDEKKEEVEHEEINERKPAPSDEKETSTTPRTPCNLGSNIAYSVSIDDTGTDYSDCLNLPTKTHEEFERVIESQNNLKMAANAKNKAWAASVQGTAKAYHKDGLFNDALSREGSEWTQKPMYDDVPVVLGRPKISNSGGMATGESAMLRIRGLVGLGTVSNVPLYASGFWVKMKAPSDDSLLALDGIIANEKYALGRITYGQAFSHNSVYITKHLVNFILDHVFESSLKDSSVENLRDQISELDYPTLIHGLLCTIYPNGYDLAQPCIASIGKCTHVTRAKVSIAKLLWTDHKRLSTKQMKRMSQRNLKVTNEDVAEYKKELGAAVEVNSIKLNANVIINFRSPSISESIEAGQRWVDDIVNTVDDAMSLNSEDRNLFIINRGQSQLLCTIAGWIENITTIDEEGEVDSVIDDIETILLTLENISEDSASSDKILNGVSDYINASTVSLFGIPDYICPECEKPQAEDGDDYLGIIPLNVENIFFSLTRQRLDLMLTTRMI